MATLTEEEEILTFDVSDEALEIAGSDKTNFTWGECTLSQPGCPPSIFVNDQPQVGKTLPRSDANALEFSIPSLTKDSSRPAYPSAGRDVA